MTVLTRFEPFREVATLQDRMKPSIPRVLQPGLARKNL